MLAMGRPMGIVRASARTSRTSSQVAKVVVSVGPYTCSSRAGGACWRTAATDCGSEVSPPNRSVLRWRKAVGASACALVEERRRDEQGANSVLCQERLEVRRRQQYLLRHDSERRPAQKRAPDFERRGVESGVGRLGDDILGCECDVIRVDDETDHRPVRHRHPLRLPRGPRGVDDVGEGLGRGRRRRVRGALAREVGPGPVEEHRRDGGRGQAREQGRLGEEHRDLGVVQHEGQPVLRVGRIERHVRPAGLEDAQEPDDHLQGPLQAEADQRVGPDAPRPQIVGQLVGPLVEVAYVSDWSAQTTATASGVCATCASNKVWMQASRG